MPRLVATMSESPSTACTSLCPLMFSLWPWKSNWCLSLTRPDLSHHRVQGFHPQEVFSPEEVCFETNMLMLFYWLNNTLYDSRF